MRAERAVAAFPCPCQAFLGNLPACRLGPCPGPCAPRHGGQGGLGLGQERRRRRGAEALAAAQAARAGARVVGHGESRHAPVPRGVSSTDWSHVSISLRPMRMPPDPPLTISSGSKSSRIFE